MDAVVIVGLTVSSLLLCQCTWICCMHQTILSIIEKVDALEKRRYNCYYIQSHIRSPRYIHCDEDPNPV